MLPHQPFGDLDSPRDRKRKAKPMDSAWLEERALRYVSGWEASESGVSALLERKILERCERTGESPDSTLEMIPKLVAQLVERNYVNDLRFAERTIERQRRKGASSAHIRARLLAKGVSETTLDSLLNDEEPGSDLQAAWKIAKRRSLGPYCDDPIRREQSRERHLGVLSRAGFDYEIALQIIDARDRPKTD